MRFVVFLLGVLSCTLTASLGAVLFFGGAVRDQARDLLGDAYKYLDVLRAPEDLAHTMGFFLMVAAGMGLLGSLLVLFRCGWQGGLLLFVGVTGPALLNPLSLAVSGFQVIPSLCSFIFVHPLPINSPVQDEMEDED